MNLTERERTILQLTRQGLSDYRIARKISTDPPSVTRSRKNAHKELLEEITDIEWATKIGVNLMHPDLNCKSIRTYSFFL
jgi:FixJ family two-component response regulator